MSHDVASVINTGDWVGRLRGFQRGEPPFREMIIDGQPLVGKGCRALEQAVHLARTSARLRRIEPFGSI